MALVPIEQVGQVGIITDVPPYSLAPQAWSGGNNVRFTDQGVENISGHIEVMLDSNGDPCPIRVKHLVFYNQRAVTDYWLAFGETKETRSIVGQIYCYTVDSKTWIDVTPDGGLTNSNSVVWSTTFLGAHLVATNGVDPMVYWPLDDTNLPTPDNKFIPVDLGLTDAVEPDNVTPQTIDSFKSFLIGTNWSNGPTRVWWSTGGGHYTMPTTWDYLDKDQDAGDYELNDSRGAVIDGAALGDAFLIYKEDSIYIANYVGPPFIFGFKVLSKDVGLLTKNALQEFPGGHVFISKYDVHITNGQEVKSLLTDKLQSQLFDDLDGDWYHRAFVASDVLNNEILICWPSAGNQGWCDKCITWNWVTGVLSLRDLPQVSDIEPGVVPLPTEGDEWDENVLTWDVISRAWGTRAFESVLPELVFAAAGEDKIYRAGVDHTFDGDVMHTVVERTGIDLGDPGSVKRVNAVWPKISTIGNNTVKVYVGSQMSPDHGVVWEDAVDFNPNEQSKVSTRSTGKYFAFKVESDGDFEWRLHGMEFNVEQGGRRGSREQ
jgi:hypothetical protein